MIINAFCRCDYSKKSNIKIEFFSNQVKITSPGGIFGATLEEVFHGVQTYRNPRLINILDKLGYIENYGTGIQRTILSYKEYRVKPSFNASDNFFIVVLPNLNYIKKIRKKEKLNDQIKPCDQINDQTNDQIKPCDQINDQTNDQIKPGDQINDQTNDQIKPGDQINDQTNDQIKPVDQTNDQIKPGDQINDQTNDRIKPGDQINDQTNDQIKPGDQINDQINDQIEIDEPLSDLSQDILFVIYTHPGIKVSRIVELLLYKYSNLNSDKVRNHIKRHLYKYIEYRGSNKTGGYFTKIKIF